MVCLQAMMANPASADQESDAKGPAGVSPRLMTRWGEKVLPERVFPEYPRPQMTRKRWENLNGLWDYAIRPTGEPQPESFDGQILVPFPVESALSRVQKQVGGDKRLWYRRTVRLAEDWKNDRVLIHFGAVDWETTVWVNGKRVGQHRGGYDPFTFDVTDTLDRQADEQEIVLSVWDPTDDGTQPRGKQRNQPHGIWYTPVTGIWQTVWLEPAPRTHIASLEIVPDVDRKTLSVKVNHRGAANVRLKATAPQLQASAEGGSGQPLELALERFELWSPDHPVLYDLTVAILDEDRTIDRVDSYFAMRKIEIGPDQNGIPRILLNGEALFQYGPLDQGWWPDGLYTAPSDEALVYDLEVTKRLGFNMVRKHVKVEPQRWYWHCDRMGLLVWQDMPNGDAHARWPVDGVEIERSAESIAQFEHELAALIDTHGNHPSIVVWVPFNEAWGQFKTVAWTDWIKRRDPTRLVISASGGNDFGVGDVRDIHVYPGPEGPPAEPVRAAVLGEFGGLGLPVKGHTWQDKKNWGYRSFQTRDALQDAYLQLMAQLRPLIESRLSAAVYTQTTDVEVEVNGLMTYDRRVLKYDADKLAAAHRGLYAPLRTLGDTERSQAYTIAYWRFEDGEPGQLVPHDRSQRDAFAVADATGHRNHVYAYSERNAPRHSDDVASATVPRLGLPNKGSLDDTAEITGRTRDLFTDAGRSRTHMNAVHTFPLNQWTIELSVKPVEPGRTQTLLGEDGKPTSFPHAPLQIQIREDNRIAVVAIDASGAVRSVASRAPLNRGEWYHLAVVSDGQTLKLLLNRGSHYEEQEAARFAGPLVNNVGTWTIGRGFHDGKLAFDARAVIDEVRVSAVSLPVRLLLWSKE